jgi:hypothetical protein
MAMHPIESQSTFQLQGMARANGGKLDCDQAKSSSRSKGRQMEPMLSFLVEERMHTLRRDGALARRSRRRAPRRRLTDASTSPVDRRSAHDV